MHSQDFMALILTLCKPLPRKPAEEKLLCTGDGATDLTPKSASEHADVMQSLTKGSVS